MPLRDTIWNNLWWKIASVVLATMIWFFVDIQLRVRIIPDRSNTPGSDTAGSSDMVVAFVRDVPVRVLVKSGQESQFRISPTKVNVSLRADKSVFNPLTLQTKEIHAFVDLTGVDLELLGKTNQFLQNVLVQGPMGVTWVKSEPLSVLVERTTPIQTNPSKNP